MSEKHLMVVGLHHDADQQKAKPTMEECDVLCVRGSW